MNRLKGKLNIPIIVIAAVLTALLTVIMLTPLSAAEVGTNAITSVTVNKNKSDLVFEISLTKEYAKENKSSSVYLFELIGIRQQVSDFIGIRFHFAENAVHKTGELRLKERDKSDENK